MLSFRSGKPFAKITGGTNHGKTLYINDGIEKKGEIGGYDYDTEKLKKYSKSQLLELKRALDEDNDDFLTGSLKTTFNKIKHNGDIGPSFHDENCTVSLIPTDEPDQRDSLYVTGPSGSGKSFYIGQFIDQYVNKYPNREIVVISAKDEDQSLDRYYPIRIPINEHLILDPVDLDELENSLVIFDDIDQLPNKHIQNAVWNLRDQILEVGRSKGISICTVSHLLTNYKASRICLNESDYCIFFPKSGAKYQIQYFLKNYAGMDKEQIKKIFNINSRAVVLKKTYPMCIIYQNGCYIV